MRSLRALETRSAVFIYGTLIILSTLSDWFYRGSPLGSWGHFGWPSSMSSWIMAIILFFLYAVIFVAMTSLTRSGTELERALQQVLSPLSYFQILLLAITSGFIEEWFFRGVLLSHFGLVLSSLAFGLMHFISGGKLWTWSWGNFLVGIALGLLFQSSQSLILVAVLHSAFNTFVLLKINQSAHRAATSSGF